MATPAETLLKLTIKGVDPAEAQRIAHSSTQGLEAEFKASMDRQAALYKLAAESANAQSTQYAQQEIKQQQTKATAILALIKQGQAQEAALTKAHVTALAEDKQRSLELQEQAERAHSTALTEILADRGRIFLENTAHTVEILRGVYEAVAGGIEKFKQFGEEIVHTTLIFESAHVPIEEAAAALDHTASKMSLILAANRANELGLTLTSKQFADIALQAKKFADATGTDAATAIEKLTQGLAEGTPKALKHLGIMIDATKAHKEFAESLGVAASQLTDEAKRLALQNEGLAELARRSAEAGKEMEKPLTVAKALELAFASMKDAWDEIISSIGKMEVPDWAKKLMGVHGDAAKSGSVDADLMQMGIDPASYKEDHPREYAEQAAKYAQSASRTQFDWTNPNGLSFGPEAPADKTKPPRDELVNAATFKKTPRDQLDKFLRKITLEHAAEQAGIAIDQRDLDAFLEDPFGENGTWDKLTNSAVRNGGNVIDWRAGSRNSAGFNSSNSPIESLFAEIDNRKTGGLDKDLSKLLGSDINKSTAEDPTKKEDPIAAAEALKAKLDALHLSAGGSTTDLGGGVEVKQMGIFESLVFGPDGPDKLYEDMNVFQKSVIDHAQEMSASVSSAGNSLATGYGKGIAAAIADGKNLKDALRNTTHDVLESLAAQSASKALMELAYAAAAEAAVLSGDIAMAPAVGAHLVAAAAFGAVGVGAALGARAVGTSSSAGSTSTSSGSSYTSGTQSSSTVDNSTGPVTLSVYVAPGGEAEAGRSIVAALTAWSAQTGKNLSHLVGNN